MPVNILRKTNPIIIPIEFANRTLILKALYVKIN
jgi:hypothetical protein